MRSIYKTVQFFSRIKHILELQTSKNSPVFEPTLYIGKLVEGTISMSSLMIHSYSVANRHIITVLCKHVRRSPTDTGP